MAQVTEERVEPKAPAVDSSQVGEAWQVLSVNDALQKQGVDAAQGLTAAEAATRLQQYGPNKFAEAAKVPGWRKFLEQYRDAMQIVLVGAALVSGFAVSQWGTALLLFGLTLFNAALGLQPETLACRAFS